MSTGTCFAVGPRGEILTAFHVVKEARPGGIFVRFEGGKQLEAQIMKLSESNDLALLRVDQPTPHYLTLTSSNNAAVGSRVFTVGYPVYGPLGTEPKYTEGVISAKSGMGSDQAVMQVQLPIQPGNSGGPLVTERGEAIGVIVSSVSNQYFLKETGTLPQGINYAVKADLAVVMVDPSTRGLPRTATPEAARIRTLASVCLVVALP